MPYISNDDIILSLDAEINFIQGNSQKYEMFLYKDSLNNPLNLNQPTSIQVAIWNETEKLLQYNSPFNSGTSGILNLDNGNNTGKIDFTITAEQGVYISGNILYAEVTVIYENFYPRPKTYIFDKIKLGSVISTEEPEGENIRPLFYNHIFEIESIDNTNPTAAGKVAFDSSTPGDVTKIKFRNLDINGVRITELENILENRITTEEANANIIISLNQNTSMYAIYKIADWARLDINNNEDNTENIDGIELEVKFEALSQGPGVSEDSWKIGEEINYRTNVYSKPFNVNDEGVSTFKDKKLIPIVAVGNFAPTGLKITHTPYADSYVIVDINGILLDVGNGNRDQHVYFSNDNGKTAKAIIDIEAGDELFWNGDIVGYNLDTKDELSFIYEKSSNITVNTDNISGVKTTDDKNLNISKPITISDGNNVPTGLTISNTPFNDANVMVEINGISIKLGSGDKELDAYFSNDGGETAKAIIDIEAGDELFWNAEIVGFGLDTEDEINFNYEV